MKTKKSIFLLGIIFLVFLGFYARNFFVKEKVEASNEEKASVEGHAWSDNIGWINFDGVELGLDTGIFSGYAWSDNIGWISFNENDLINCPSGKCRAEMDLETKNITGWAKTLTANGDHSWDGWISLDQAQFEPGKGITGWGWDSLNTGWVSFNCLNEGNCNESNYKVDINFPIKAKMDCEIIKCDICTCSEDEWITYNNDNVFYKIKNESTGDLTTSTWSIIGYQDPYITFTSDPDRDLPFPSSDLSSGDYTVKLKVKDNRENYSIATHSITVKQSIIANFECSRTGQEVWMEDCSKINISQGETIFLKDSSEFSKEGEVEKRIWKKDGVIIKENTEIATTTLESEVVNLTLEIEDNQGGKDSITKTINPKPPLPNWEETNPNN